MLWDLKNVLDKIVDSVDIVDIVDVIEIVHAVVMGGNVDVVNIDIVDIVDIVQASYLSKNDATTILGLHNLRKKSVNQDKHELATQ